MWGWYDTKIAQAWIEIALAVQAEDSPLLIDMVWLQEISPFWNFLTDIPRIDGNSLSTKSSLSAIAGAEICPISRGGLLCNTVRIRREEGDAINANSLQLGRKSEISQISSDCEMRAHVQALDPLLGVEGGGVSRVSIYLDNDTK